MEVEGHLMNSADFNCSSASVTGTRRKRCFHSWSIMNFYSRQDEVGEFLVSRNFSPTDDTEIKMCLRLYPKGKDAACRGFLSLYLYLLSSNTNGVKVDGKFAMPEYKFAEKKFKGRMKDGSTLGISKIMHRNELVFNKNSYLNIWCEVVLEWDVVCDYITFETELFPADPPSSSLGTLLYQSKKFCDVTFLVNDEEITAHKSVLATSSPVFEAMFLTKMKENSTNVVDITDVAPHVFKQMLKYIYTGTVGNLSLVAKELLPLAHMYNVEKLKNKCVSELLKEINCENVSELLIFSELYELPLLKEKSIPYINQHSLEVLKTPSWHKLLDYYPKLVAELYYDKVRN